MKKKLIFKILFLSFAFTILHFVNAFALGWVDDGGDNWRYIGKDDLYAISTIQSSGDDKYYLDENGYMVRDYLLENYNDAIYYFDEDGKMVKNTWVAIDQTQVYSQMDNPPSIYLYYFGNDGKAYRSSDGLVKKTIDGKKYLFNEDGQMLSGWINEQGERYNEIENSEDDPFAGYCYYAGDETDGVLREGWTAWEEGSTDDRYYQKQTLWFYFKPNDNKKYQAGSEGVLLKKDINGKTYTFDNNGVMTEGWDAEALDPNNEDVSISANKYFIEGTSDSGRMAKKQWFYAVPSQKQNLDDHDAESKRWFYSTNSGDVVTETMRKINSDYYVFDKFGIMKTGLCIVEKTSKKYVDTIDTESTDGKDFIISRYYISKDVISGEVFELFDDSKHSIYYFNTDETDEDNFGKRKTLKATVPFGDDDYDFSSKASGEFEGYKDKKFFQNGIKLAADKTLGFGLVFVGYSNDSKAISIDYKPQYNISEEERATHTWAREDKNHAGTWTDYMVLKDDDAIAETKYPVFHAVDKSGGKVNRSNVVKKDKTGNYWAIGQNAAVLGIYDVPIRFDKSSNRWQYKSEKTEGDKNKTMWIDFGDYGDNNTDIYGKACYYDREKQNNNPGYSIEMSDAYAVNFRFAD